MDSYIAKADSLVDTFTGKTGWTSGDTAYEAVQMASNVMAAAMIREHYRDTEGKAKGLRDEFWRLVKEIKNTSADTSSYNEGYTVKTAGSES